MERFAAMVTGHRASPFPAPGPAAKVDGKRKGNGKVVEDAAYLSIQLEEIVIVKNNDGAARGRSALPLVSGASTSMGQRVEAAAAPPSGMSAAAASSARGALSTAVGWIVGSESEVADDAVLGARVSGAEV